MLGLKETKQVPGCFVLFVFKSVKKIVTESIEKCSTIAGTVLNTFKYIKLYLILTTLNCMKGSELWHKGHTKEFTCQILM